MRDLSIFGKLMTRNIPTRNMLTEKLPTRTIIKIKTITSTSREPSSLELRIPTRVKQSTNGNNVATQEHLFFCGDLSCGDIS